MKNIIIIAILALFAFESQAGNRIVISKKDLTLYVISEEGETLYRCGIACGKVKGNKVHEGDSRTPEGHFSVLSISDSRHWLFEPNGRRIPNCYGPWFIRVNVPEWGHHIGIHGTGSPRSIGTRASLGCIRCHNDDIVNVVKFVSVGDPISILPDYSPDTTL